ncbi:hypothetical protein MMC25_004228 [Agyrium rufum]|nr:hypothetical protein [Agyrium rufum]
MRRCSQTRTHHCIPECETSHRDNPIPEEPQEPRLRKVSFTAPRPLSSTSLSTSPNQTSSSASDSESPTTPEDPEFSNPFGSDANDAKFLAPLSPKSGHKSPTSHHRRKGSTVLISSNDKDVRRILGDGVGTTMVEKVCCGGGCCFLSSETAPKWDRESHRQVKRPENEAYQSLRLELGLLGLETELTNLAAVPEQTITLESIPSTEQSMEVEETYKSPPRFVQPHPPYNVYPAKLLNARELTKPGAEKRTYHFDLDVTDYPKESGNVDFVVGGAVGICAPNSDELVDEIFDILGVPRFVRDKPVKLRTTQGRWPTIWGEEMARELITTRRALLKWCADVQSYPPTKSLLRLLGEHAEDENERQILLYLSSAQGQASFCDLRTGPHITLAQLLNAFPSSKPPLELLFSTLNQLMPRFYSLSQDPQSAPHHGSPEQKRVIEVAVSIHETPNWRGGPRTGTGSGFLERMARQLISAKQEEGPIEGLMDGVGHPAADRLDIRIPMFRGLMANPLAREFVSDGPMLLIGAGVGIAPFRGFVQKRLKSANCANKVWVLQGVRDALLDELYSGEWGVDEEKVKKVVQSRRGTGRYVQEEVRHQADLVWFVINALDGRVFVCGSSKGMGEGVEEALVDVAMDKGTLNAEEARAFWEGKKKAGQYVAYVFSGPTTFAHLPQAKCLTDPSQPFDIAILGAPFDTATSYRPGARFGPRAIRHASSRQIPFRAFNPRRGLNPYDSPFKVLDCADIPISPFSNKVALKQMTSAFGTLYAREPAMKFSQGDGASSWFPHPKILTLGGDHSIALPALRALNAVYGGPVAVLHFDAHLDTWHPGRYPSGWDPGNAETAFNHGSMFWMASGEGLILNGSSAHAGLRTRLSGLADWEDDDRQGFLRISADDIDDLGTRGIIDAILERMGTEVPVYLSLDIDVLDPGLCPGTGTPEPGGWTSREVIRILRGLEDLNVVGADIVEVAPAYDGVGEQTSLVAAQIGFEIITSWVSRGLKDMEKAGKKGSKAEIKDEL